MSSYVALDTERRIKFARAIIAAFAYLAFGWLVFALIFGRAEMVGAVVFGAWPSWVALVLIWYRRTSLARLFWLLSFPLITFVSTLVYGSLIDPELVFLTLLGFPLLFFSWQSEKPLLWGTFCYVSALSIVALSLDFFGAPPWALQAPANLPVSLEAINWGIRISLAAILLLELAYFAYLVQRSAHEADDALEEARASAKSKGQFLANMSHEIRTPMNGMIGMIEVLEASGLDANQKRSIGTIRNSAFSLLRILDDILDASQIDAGKLSLERSKVELRPLAEGAAQTLQGLADTMEVRMRMLVSPMLPEWVWIDSGRLRQIILNLLSNAIKYSAKRLTGHVGMVHFRMAQDDGELLIEVTDNGIGMSETVQDNLFQPFSQGEGASRQQVGGTGLGLAITQSIVQLMGGTITLDSKPHAGTVIRVTLPLQPADGPSNLADISGLRIICFDLLDETVRQGITELLAGAKASVHFVTFVDEIPDLLPPGESDPIFLLPTPDVEQGDALETQLRATFPAARIVRFSASRYARYGLLDPQTYLIQIYPMMGTELFRALAQLDGRIALTADDDTTDPTLESAEVEHPTRVLVVEDNEINRTVLGKQLDILGYPHQMAANGVEALELCRNQDFNLILCDCHMPLMDGFAFTVQLRSLETETNHPRTPIIAVTANAMQGEAERCLAIGMDDYLAKPVEMETLKRKLRNTLHKSQQTTE